MEVAMEVGRALRAGGDYVIGAQEQAAFLWVPLSKAQFPALEGAGSGFLSPRGCPSFGSHPSRFITAGSGNGIHWWLYIGAAFTWGQGAKDG